MRKITLVLIFKLCLINIQAQFVHPYIPIETVDPAKLKPPTPSNSANQCIIWNGTSWAYWDWDLSNLFATSTHTHVIADVTGLQTALDNKYNQPAGTTSQYVRGDGSLATFPVTSGEATTVGNTATVNLTLTGVNITADVNNASITPAKLDRTYLETEVDGSVTNEIQDLSLASNILSLTGDATTVNLTPYLDNTDNQDLSLSSNILSLTNDGTTVNLTPYLDNTDAQTLSLSTNQLQITGGNTVTFTGWDTNAADDITTETDPTVKAIIGIVKSNGTTISAAVANTDYLTPSGNGSALTNVVHSIGVTTANGISGSSSGGDNPSLTLSLGAITPTSIVASGNISGLNLSGTNTGDQTNITGNAGTATALQNGRTFSLTGDGTGTSSAFDGTANNSIPLTLATVNASPQTDQFRKITVNGKGLLTASSAVTATDINNTFGTQTNNLFYATPNGAAGLPSLRAIAVSDIPTLNQNTTGSAATLLTGRTFSVSGDATGTSGTFNGSANATIPLTLATVNGNVGTFGNASNSGTFTVNNKGLITAASNTPIQIAESQVTNLVTDLAGKEPVITAGTTSQYYRGDKSFQTLDKAAVGLANVDNTTDLNKPISTATQTALDNKANSSHTHALSDLTQSSATTGQVIKWNGTAWIADTDNAGGVSDGDKGDLTVGNSGTVWTIDNTVVTNAKLANVPAKSIKGSIAGGTPSDITAFSDFNTLFDKQVITLSGNVSNSTVTLSSSGLTFSVVAGQSYQIELTGMFQSAATTTGIGMTLDIPGGTINGMIQHNNSATSIVVQAQVADNTIAYSGIGTTSSAIANSNVAIKGDWFYDCNTTGTVTLNFRSEIAGSAITLQSGMKLIVTRIL